VATPGRIVGIDLGTTNTVVAWADPGDAEARIHDLAQLVSASEVETRPLLPSFLYAPVPGEVELDPWGDAPWVVGELARRRGAEVPGRLVASAKSWLCHSAVDRTADILPWGASEEARDLPRISPVDASARYLRHLAAAYNAGAASPLSKCDVVLTVPASFDEVARELTLEAARRASLSVRLLEEPQATFYDVMARVPDAIEALVSGERREALVLVCDVGGGTTDLSLMRVRRGTGGRPFDVERVAVGHHLLLGGDNMDLALAHLCEARLVEPPARLDPGRFAQLVLACRAAKERLLGDAPPDAVPVTLLTSGARLIGSTLTAQVGREEAERLLLDGFLPIVPRDARPARSRSALVAFGLPYERDVAITRHVAWFFARHAPDAAGPDALLLNGGVFRAAGVARRIAEAIQSWGGPELVLLPQADPDLSVARGAVVYGLARRGRGTRIEGGAARGYYVGLDAGSDPNRGRRALCVVPRGAKEGVRHVVDQRPLSLIVGRPVRFELFASDDASSHRAGDVVTIDDERFQALPPAIAQFGAVTQEAKPARGISTRPTQEIPVALEGEVTPIGTLELALVEIAAPEAALPEPRRFRLAFQLRETMGPSPKIHRSSLPPASIGGRRLDDARDAIWQVFGKGRADATAREAKNLVRELERIVGERSTWTTELARTLCDVMLPQHRSRRRSPDHERMFWSLTGYCLRPGFGHPIDADRIRIIAPLFAERLAFADEPRGWQQFWIAWRRIAGGLDESAQLAIRDTTDPLLAPAEKRLKKPKGFKLEAEFDLLDLVSSLERVPPPRRSELGAWILEKTWTDRDTRLWTALGRLGARVPAYASVHHVVSPVVAERWIEHLLREKWNELPTASQAAVQLARVTNDRARDVSERARREVERRLATSGARDEWVRAVREFVPMAEGERAAFFGETLPVGLRLAD
jgi:molecular chaperone DnaK (HSP70)